MELVRGVGRAPTEPLTNGGDRHDRDVFYISFDPDQEGTTQVILEAVATIKHVDPMDLEPLYHSVEPDAFETLMRQDGSIDVIEFVYHDLDITVEPDGEVWLRWTD